jgi:pimeloyl-ACP methyl ester carboxylesterase
VRPTHVRDGLAVYDIAVYDVGSGEPVLHMPYPHAAAVAGDRTLTALVRGLEALGWQVVRFDPPGAGRSTRPMRLDLPEMLECA